MFGQNDAGASQPQTPTDDAVNAAMPEPVQSDAASTMQPPAGWGLGSDPATTPDTPATDLDTTAAEAEAAAKIAEAAIQDSTPAVDPMPAATASTDEPTAYKWKISFNENAKNVAWCNQLPEFNHNEMLGWSSHPTDKPYGVIDLRSHLDHPRVQKRFEVTGRLLSGKRPRTHVIQVQGETLEQQLFWAIAMGDFVSLYLALLNGINPTPVDLIEKFKKALDE